MAGLYSVVICRSTSAGVIGESLSEESLARRNRNYSLSDVRLRNYLGPDRRALTHQSPDRTALFSGKFGQSEDIAPDASESAIGTRWYKKIDPSQNRGLLILQGKCTERRFGRVSANRSDCVRCRTMNIEYENR